jgi:O-succinylbenzoic acid--CoA ligase
LLSEQIDFVAFVPTQLQQSLAYDLDKLQQIDQILVGGGQMSPELLAACQSAQLQVWHSYGMTETLSHIAIQDVQKNNDLYYTLPNIQITQDHRNCLVIQTNFLPEKIVTNDVVEIVNSSSFKYLGRLDNVINSGGIKIFPELLEEKIRPIFQHRRYVFFGIPAPIFGEKLALVIEGKNDICDLQIQLKSHLSAYLYPKEIFFFANFPTTVTGKIQRKLLVSMLKKTIM